MKLFTRNANEWDDDDAQSMAWAHSILDLWKAGEPYEMETINHALRLTGDLIGLDANAYKEAA